MGTRRSQVRMSQEAMRSLLYLPDDAFIFGADFNPRTTNVTIFFTSNEVDEVSEGAEAIDFTHLEHFSKGIV